jgi:hypothetical protein
MVDKQEASLFEEMLQVSNAIVCTGLYNDYIFFLLNLG